MVQLTVERANREAGSSVPAPSRRLARLVGVLFIVATVTAIVSSALLDSVIDGTGYLSKLAGHQDRVLAGAFFQILAAFSCAGIGIALYPAVRLRGVAFAVGAASFRVVEGTFYLVGAIGTLLLLELGQEFAHAANPGSAYFQTTGTLLHALRDNASVTALLAFYLGASLYYYAFLSSRLLPRWLSIWGLIGVTLGAAAALCVLFEAAELGSTLQLTLNIPIGIQEMVLAAWLIVKGFTPGGAPSKGQHSKPRLPPRWFVLAFWHLHRALYRITGGRVGLWTPRPGRWGTLRLTTIGRRSGKARSVMLGYFEDGDGFVTLAMNGWAAGEPSWWLNLQARPDAVVEVRGKRREVRARAAAGAERDRLWQRWREIDRNLDAYAALRPKETAVVVLESRSRRTA